MTSGTARDIFAVHTSQRRSWSAGVASVIVHAVLLMGVALLAAQISSMPAGPREYQPVTFVMMAPLPIPHEAAPPLRLSPAVKREIAAPVPVELAKPEV